ncbi:hypothetical protein BP6252_08009 [Coleophoma cylindrospora]|uniref:Heterokaryon incompatibility domain-containing protein n=1 Tax=Coleophoma cylindrospora TaxID=1849047 RepID=A0A3D8RBV4_9HELO|nr:hypothetical protein BP6252_08009 [Coleophoma cylindrospora]
MEQLTTESTDPYEPLEAASSHSSTRTNLESNDAFNPRLIGPPLYTSVDNTALCLDCQERFDESHFQRVGERCEDGQALYLMHEYKISRKEVKLNAKDGCRMCSLINYQGSRDAETVRWFLRCHPTQEGQHSQLPDVREVVMQYHNLEADNPELTHGYTSLHAHASRGNPAGKYVSARDIISDFRSGQAFDRVKGWLAECTERHEYCSRPIARPLPTRVIHVPQHDMSQLCLVDTDGIPGDYAALSYAWGPDSQPNKTTSSNLGVYHNQIILSNLPQTLQDAIHITQTLNINYLWVDSMCIIQDSNEDKIVEISKMRHIFKNAFCTIIGARSPTSSQGFLDNFPLRYPLLEEDIIIPYGSSADTGDKGTMTLREAGGFKQADIIRDFTESRAWCLEESVLSPRCIIYSNIRLRWSCAQTQYSDGDYTHNEESEYKIKPLPRLFRLGQKREAEDDDDWEELWKFWISIVTNYSTRELTRPDDKLRAISGLVDEIHALYCDGDDEYLTGIWKRKLFPGLMWFIMPRTRLDNVTYLQPRIRDIAPSWSWASTNGTVAHYNGGVNINPQCDIIDWYGKVSRKEPFNRAVDAALEVEGRLKKAIWDADRLSVYDETELPPQGSQSESEDYSIRSLAIADGFPDTNETVGIYCRVYCLELGYIERQDRRGSSSKETVGLLLFRARKGKGVFSRYGLFKGYDLDTWFEGVVAKRILII